MPADHTLAQETLLREARAQVILDEPYKAHDLVVSAQALGEMSEELLIQAIRVEEGVQRLLRRPADVIPFPRLRPIDPREVSMDNVLRAMGSE